MTFKSHLSDNFSVKGIVSPSQNRKYVENTVKQSNSTIEDLLINNDTNTHELYTCYKRGCRATYGRKT